MYRAACLFALALMVPLAAAAQCTGEDLRATLTDAERSRLDAAVAATPYPEGNHWRAEKAGEVLHLVGTVHLSDPRLDAPMDRLRPLIPEAGAVLLEMTGAERSELTEAMRNDPGLLMLNGKTLPELLPEADWQALAAKLSERGIPSFVAAKMQPWYLMSLLSLPPCAMDAMSEQNGLDTRIEAAADASGVPTRALEPFDAALKILGDGPVEQQIGYLDMAAAASEQDGDGLVTTLDAYFDERHVEFWQLTPILMARTDDHDAVEAQDLAEDFGAAMLADRNRAWLPVILDTLAGTDKPVIAAFGAAHLGGEDGVLNLLAQEGFTLTREPF